MTQLDLHFTPSDWERVNRNWSAWWAGELERALVLIEHQSPHPIYGHQSTLPAGTILPFLFPESDQNEEAVRYLGAWLESRRFWGDSFPKWWPNFGPGIGSAFLGGPVRVKEDTVWFEVSTPGDIAALNPQYDADNPWWQRVRQLTAKMVEAWGGQVAVGHTDLGSALDILAALRTSMQLLYDVYEAAEEVARLCGAITEHWIRFYDELYDMIALAGRGTTPWGAIWSPGRCYMLQSDFSAMISPQMFAQFVIPELDACCRVLDHAFFHLDGPGQLVHLDLLLELEGIQGIQWIPGAGADPPQQWLPLLRRIRDANKLCQLYVTARGALDIVKALGGKGFAFCIDDDMDADEAAAFLHLFHGYAAASIPP